MKFIGIIPARYASTRFPGKPLADLCGKPVVQHVYEQTSKILDTVIVATDDQRIYNCVRGFGGLVYMTSSEHRCGTDRICEAYQLYKQDAKNDDDTVIVNIQGDEPFIQRSQLESVMACFKDSTTDIATLVKPFTPEDGWEALSNPNSPKVVVGSNMDALYFSRSVIPYLRGEETNEWLSRHTYYKHIGL